jgi:hypothetical protein
MRGNMCLSCCAPCAQYGDWCNWPYIMIATFLVPELALLVDSNLVDLFSLFLAGC